MKTRLAASLSLAVLLAGNAPSMAEEPLEGTISGMVGTRSLVGQGQGRGERPRHRTELDLAVDGEAWTDSGLGYGFHVLGSKDDEGFRFTEASVFLAGDWGRVELGRADGVSETLAVTAPMIGLGQLDSPSEDFFGYPQSPRLARDSGLAPKLTYVSPSLGGLQLGASLAMGGVAQGRLDLDEQTALDLMEGGFTDLSGLAGEPEYPEALELAATYRRELDGFDLALSAGWVRGKAPSTSLRDAQVPDAAATVEFRPLRSWQVGFSLSRGPVTVGGAYIDDASAGRPSRISGTLFNFEDDDLVPVDEALPPHPSKGWVLGASYLGEGFSAAAAATVRDLPDGRLRAVGAGVEVPLAEGLVALGDAVTWEAPASRGTLLVLGVRGYF